jgi:acetylornithine/succinyldiaminopimelate/putrescine aminotransferase
MTLATTTETRTWPDEGVEQSYTQHVNPGRVEELTEFFRAPYVMGDRAGARFRDQITGRWFWDCHVNGGTFNLGHRNPQIQAALLEALDHVDIGNSWLPSAHRAALGERLAASTDGALDGAILLPSGGEAADVAIKFARAMTGRRGIVSIQGGYHGHTGLALATGAPRFSERFGHELPGFTHVPYNDPDAMVAAVSGSTAAVIIEAIPATLGMPQPDPGYLSQVEAICRRHGALLIIDEVQTGLGRTGTMWSYQQDGIQPDMVMTGKGLSGGIYPVAATLMRAELMQPLRSDSFAHVATFGGSELGCAVATAVLDVTEEPGFLDRVEPVGARFAQAFEGLDCTVRRRGLFMGVAWKDEATCLTATQRLQAAGIWAVFAGNDRSVTQFLPPLILTDDETEQIIASIGEALA